MYLGINVEMEQERYFKGDKSMLLYIFLYLEQVCLFNSRNLKVYYQCNMLLKKILIFFFIILTYKVNYFLYRNIFKTILKAVCLMQKIMFKMLLTIP